MQFIIVKQLNWWVGCKCRSQHSQLTHPSVDFAAMQILTLYLTTSIQNPQFKPQFLMCLASRWANFATYLTLKPFALIDVSHLPGEILYFILTEVVVNVTVDCSAGGNQCYHIDRFVEVLTWACYSWIPYIFWYFLWEAACFFILFPSMFILYPFESRLTFVSCSFSPLKEGEIHIA